jgi:hypothetical protein
VSKIQAYNWSALGQSLLDIGIKAGVFAVLLLLNFVSAALSGGSFQLPYPAITLPVATLVVSQLDSKFVAWAQKDNIPVPQQ